MMNDIMTGKGAGAGGAALLIQGAVKKSVRLIHNVDIVQVMAAVTLTPIAERLQQVALLAELLCFPPSCVSCHTPISAYPGLCNTCFEQMHRISEPCCDRCGTPFIYAGQADGICPDCLETPPLYDEGRAVWCYDEQSSQLIKQLKYRDQVQLAPYLARMMAEQGKVLLDRADIIAPVPLHPRRLRQRRYNQAERLARHLVRLMRKRHGSAPALKPELLQRSRFTPAQAQLAYSDRMSNVKDAFQVTPLHEADIPGNGILLIDDVITTGATLAECSRALREAQASWIGVLTVAKRIS